LGNPGREYERTPHNAGFMAVDELARRAGCRLRRSFRFRSMLATGALDGADVLLAEPQTFMNDSGSAVASIAGYWKVPAPDVIVVLDDADLEVGQLRVRRKGSSGGHRGLTSVIRALGSDEVVRVRVGIGRGHPGENLVRHVLRPLGAEAREQLAAAAIRAADAVACILQNGPDRAMNDFNASAAPPREGRAGD
jgi:PTH1 family peptidyl-tRNA hydrolase